MDLKAILGAVAGALIGAIAWGAIAHFTGYEIGFVAWGIGGLVGFGASFLGGSGNQMGIICAVLAIVSIVIGKWIALDMSLAAELDMIMEEEYPMEVYEQIKKEAAVIGTLESDEDLWDFMIEYGYSAGPTPQDISQQEYQDFRAYVVPELLRFHESPPTFERWREIEGEFIMTQVSKTDILVSSLHPLDALFALLGISTAWRLGRGSGDEADPA